MDLCFNQGMLGLGYSNSLCAVMNHGFEKLGKSTNQINLFLSYTGQSWPPQSFPYNCK